MKKTKMFSALAFFILIFIVTACNRENVDRSTQSANSASYMNYSGLHIQRQLDTNLNVDADVIVPSNIQSFNTLLVSPIKLETRTQALETLLVAKSKVIQKNAVGDSGNFYRTEDGKELFIDNGTVNFQTDKFRTYIYHLINAYIIPGDTFYNLDRFKEKRNLDLPFMPHQQAVDNVKKELTSLGISLYDKVETYSLDYKTLQTEEEALKDSGKLSSPRDGKITLKDGWSKEDDLYYMIFRSGFDNVPVYPLDHGTVEENTIVPGSYIYVCYSQKGLEYLSISNAYQKKAIDQVGVKIISIDDALAVVKQKYANVILTNTTTVTSIELNYLRMLINQSRDEFRMVPAWCFEFNEVRKDGKGGKDGKGEPYNVHIRMIIDATTGGEIL